MTEAIRDLDPTNEYGAYLDERLAACRKLPSLAALEALAVDAISFALDHPYDTEADSDRCVHCGDTGSYAHTAEAQREWRASLLAPLADPPSAEPRETTDDEDFPPGFFLRPEVLTKLRESIPAEWLHAASPRQGEPVDDPEATCQRCGHANARVWHAPSPLWNAVMRDRETGLDRWGIVCPTCFAELADEAGCLPSDRRWHFAPDGVDVAELWADRDGRVWDPATCLWVAEPSSEPET